MVNVQAQCMAAVAEGSTNPVTLRLSKLGATGKHANNIERDFGNWIKKFVFQQHSILQRLSCYWSSLKAFGDNTTSQINSCFLILDAL